MAKIHLRVIFLVGFELHLLSLTCSQCLDLGAYAVGVSGLAMGWEGTCGQCLARTLFLLLF